MLVYLKLIRLYEHSGVVELFAVRFTVGNTTCSLLSKKRSNARSCMPVGGQPGNRSSNAADITQSERRICVQLTAIPFPIDPGEMAHLEAVLRENLKILLGTETQRIYSNTGELNIVFGSSRIVLRNWIQLRDLKAELIYEGWVSDFSDTVEECELLIRDIKVYTLDDAEPVSENEIDTPALYISRKRDQISVEFMNANKKPFGKKPKGSK